MPPSRFFRECIRSALRPKPKSGKLGNMATVNMLRFTHHDANVIAALAQFPGSPEEMKKKRLASLEEEDARLVGEVLVGVRDYSSVSPAVQASVDLYRAWVENHRQRRRKREARQHSSRSR